MSKTDGPIASFERSFSLPTTAATDPFAANLPFKEPPNLCDQRLAHLNIRFWTEVSIPNSFAARVISLYLETDHPLLAAFDPELFVGDLVNCKSQFCSKFLVSTVLYWGCVSDTILSK